MTPGSGERIDAGRIARRLPRVHGRIEAGGAGRSGAPSAGEARERAGERARHGTGAYAGDGARRGDGRDDREAAEARCADGIIEPAGPPVGSEDWIALVTDAYRASHGFRPAEAVVDPAPWRRSPAEELGIPPCFGTATPDDFPGVALDPERRRSVFLFGGPGAGKSRAAAALALLWGLRWVFVPMLMVRIRRTFRPGVEESELDIVNELIGASGIVLDDILGATKTDFGLATLFLIVNGRLESERITVVTSDRNLAGIDALDSGLASRLATFSPVKIGGRDRRVEP